ncbi:uncharacterized protein BXZ73DRAFT_92103 [Epithele typhae]|uniref:uncharacterized protein n=1 Tax=Epithele typhae TaxID=378194 RepID=UPI0020086F45|nr:uncharacterized protein BXZ73DRAFT_92103 [Epithele typhae]KAH9919164.1 hypothetical protein BXZ73DRAFT_92103 [Epithele typhae]
MDSKPYVALLPPDVYNIITSHLSVRDLFPLAHTSKAFQRAAESRIYETLVLRDAQRAILCLHSLGLHNAARTSYVRRLYLYQDPGRTPPRLHFGTIPVQFWSHLQAALLRMPRLEYIMFGDPTASHAWVLHHADRPVPFQLREANFNLAWGPHLAAFLNRQKRLRIRPLCALEPGALPALQVLSAPVLVVAEILVVAPPVTHLQIVADDDTMPLVPTLVADAAETMPGLINLSFLGLPTVWRALMGMPALKFVVFDFSRWAPLPTEVLQKMVVLDLQIYAPGVRQVVVWIEHHRLCWVGRPLSDSSWRHW